MKTWPYNNNLSLNCIIQICNLMLRGSSPLKMIIFITYAYEINSIETGLKENYLIHWLKLIRITFSMLNLIIRGSIRTFFWFSISDYIFCMFEKHFFWLVRKFSKLMALNMKTINCFCWKLESYNSSLMIYTGVKMIHLLELCLFATNWYFLMSSHK